MAKTAIGVSEVKSASRRARSRERSAQEAPYRITDYPMHYFAAIQRQNQLNLARSLREFGLSVPDLVPEFRKLTIPVLGVCGDRDPYPDQPEVLRGMANFREAPQISGAARFVHWEKPAEFNAVVRAFVRTLP